MWRTTATLLMAGSLAACTVDKQEAPSLMGPSGFGQSMTFSASPDRIAHNGTAQSVVTLTVRNEDGQPATGVRVSVGASTGTSSHVDVVTGADGRASFIITAPPLSTPAEQITVFGIPFGTNADNSRSQTMTIALTGILNATAPTASFTFEPEAPADGGAMVFDASGTTDEGQTCGSLCFYSWDFGGLGAGLTEGQAVARNALNAGTYAVTLTVRDNAGTVSSTTRTVTVSAPAGP